MAGLHIQTELLARICVQAGIFAGLCSHLLRQGFRPCSLAWCSGSAAGCILGMGRAARWAPHSSMVGWSLKLCPPGLMVPLAGLYIQSKPYTGLCDQMGTQAILLDQIGTTGSAPKLGESAGYA